MKQADLQRAARQLKPDERLKHRIAANVTTEPSRPGWVSVAGMLAVVLFSAVLVAGGMFLWQGRGAPEEIPFMPGLGAVDESDGPATPTDLAADLADMKYEWEALSLYDLDKMLKGIFGGNIVKVYELNHFTGRSSAADYRNIVVHVDRSGLTKEETGDLCLQIEQLFEKLTFEYDGGPEPGLLICFDADITQFWKAPDYYSLPYTEAEDFWNEDKPWQYAEAKEVWDEHAREVYEALKTGYTGALERYLIDPENAEKYVEEFQRLWPLDDTTIFVHTVPVEVDGELKIALDISYKTGPSETPVSFAPVTPVIDSEFPWAIEPIMQDGRFVGLKETSSEEDEKERLGWSLFRDGDDTNLYHGCDRNDIYKEQVIFNGENTVCTVLYMYFLGDATDVSEPGEYTLVVTDLRTNEKIYRLQITQP